MTKNSWQSCQTIFSENSGEWKIFTGLFIFQNKCQCNKVCDLSWVVFLPVLIAWFTKSFRLKHCSAFYLFPIITLSANWLRGGIHIQTATQKAILVFSSRPYHPPLKMSNAKHTMFIRNINSLAIRDTIKMLCFLISKDITYFHRQENKKNLLLNVIIKSQKYIKLKTERRRYSNGIEKH